MQNSKTSRRSLLMLLGGLLTGCAPLVAAPQQGGGARNNSQAPLPSVPLQTPPGRQVATIAGGCFWCLDTLFAQLKGVDKVASGYAGGSVANPSYEAVCTGTTGHAEAIQITFDPKVISYADLLHIFFSSHDPTTRNRQGPDVGTQYRSAIFYSDEQQKSVAEKVIKEVNAEKLYRYPIVTEVTAYKNFYTAEDYHQNYYGKNPNQGYCRVVIAPKVAKFRKKYLDRLKS
ncbi:MAG: peptide-methionine (S)-S-oxide reductase MsrA [Armatimonadota bacterium]